MFSFVLCSGCFLSLVFLCFVLLFFFFFFKQKTAYEMRISDWSSDVCSSDLDGRIAGEMAPYVAGRQTAEEVVSATRAVADVEVDVLTFVELLGRLRMRRNGNRGQQDGSAQRLTQDRKSVV